MERLGDALNRLRIATTIFAVATDTFSSAEEAAEEPSGCPRCRGAGYLRSDVPVGHADFGKLIACDCRKDEIAEVRRNRLERLSNLGPLVHHTFSTLNRQGRSADPARQESFQAALAVAERYASRPEGWLVLLGPPGCGKTHLAAAIANARIAEGQAVLFTVVPDLLDYLRATYRPTSDVGYDEVFDHIRSAEVLILDDLGTQSSTPWAQEKLFQIVNHRYNAKLPTVVTSNLRPEEFEERLRMRLTDPALAPLGPDGAGPSSPVVVVEQWEEEALQRLRGLSLERLQEMTFANFDVRGMSVEKGHRDNLRGAFDTARSFAANPQGWLIFVGGTARGKTHLAVAIANEREAQGHSVPFVTVPDLLDYLRSAYAPDSKVSYDRVFEAIKTARLLVLDDLGAQSSTPWALEKLFQLLNYRYNAKLPTVVTSNVLMEDHDPRLRSRMLDPSFSVVYLIDAPPYRLEDRPAPTRPLPPRPKRRP